MLRRCFWFGMKRRMKRFVGSREGGCSLPRRKHRAQGGLFSRFTVADCVSTVNQRCKKKVLSRGFERSNPRNFRTVKFFATPAEYSGCTARDCGFRIQSASRTVKRANLLSRLSDHQDDGNVESDSLRLPQHGSAGPYYDRPMPDSSGQRQLSQHQNMLSETSPSAKYGSLRCRRLLLKFHALEAIVFLLLLYQRKIPLSVVDMRVSTNGR